MTNKPRTNSISRRNCIETSEIVKEYENCQYCVRKMFCRSKSEGHWMVDVAYALATKHLFY